jgi:hypothetical protein
MRPARLPYRGTSLTRNSLPLETYNNKCSGPYGDPRGGGVFDERGTPVESQLLGRHMYDSQDQILVWASRPKSLKPFKVSPLRSDADWAAPRHELRLTDYSQVDTPGSRYKSVNFGADWAAPQGVIAVVCIYVCVHECERERGRGREGDR